MKPISIIPQQSRVAEITMWSVPLTSHVTYSMAAGKECATVDSIVLRLTTDTGLEGWGEVCPIPHYLPAYADGVAPAILHMADEILGTDPCGVEAAMHKFDAFLPGHDYAKSILDIALWDLFGKAVGQPLYAILGGRARASMPLYHSITCIDPDEMARIAKDALDQGMRQFQAKLGADADWQADVARLIKVREAVGPGPLVYGDWNCGATQLDATRVGRAVMHHDIMLEQPCGTLEECAAVHNATGLPMKIDELAHDFESLMKAHRLGCMDAMALKLSKFGGLSASRRARDICVELGTQMCVECVWGSDIVMAAALHLGASCPAGSLMNVCDLSGYVSPRIALDAPTRQDGRIAPPTGPGLGVTPDMDVLGTPIAEYPG